MPDPNTEHGLRVQLTAALLDCYALRARVAKAESERDALRALLSEARGLHPGCKQGTFTKEIEKYDWKEWREGTPYDWRCTVCVRIDAALATGGDRG